MQQKSRKFLLFTLVAVVALQLGAVPAYAMHIMEGFLPPLWCIVWAAAALPFLVLGIRKLTKILSENRRQTIILAMAGAFAFVLSALKIPSVTGSSSHMTGLGFASILFGPFVSCVLGFIVLLFQALLLAHGGLTTLGANVFSMGVVGPFVAFGVFALCKKLRVDRKIAIFLAAMLGDLFTYIVTSLQLGFAFPANPGGTIASVAKFLGIFAVTQIPLAVVEGILTVIILNFVEAYGKDRLPILSEGERRHG